MKTNFFSNRSQQCYQNRDKLRCHNQSFPLFHTVFSSFSNKGSRFSLKTQFSLNITMLYPNLRSLLQIFLTLLIFVYVGFNYYLATPIPEGKSLGYVISRFENQEARFFRGNLRSYLAKSILQVARNVILLYQCPK